MKMHRFFAAAFALLAGAWFTIRAWFVGIEAISAPTLAPDKAKPECQPSPAVKQVQATAYMLRQAKREWPTVAARWRMCPAG